MRIMTQSTISIGKSPFEVVYGMHPRGVYEMRDISGLKKRSAHVEDFIVTMKDIHEQVRDTLKKSVGKYKESADLRKKDVQYKVRDMVFSYLRMERFPKGKYNKLMMKKNGP